MTRELREELLNVLNSAVALVYDTDVDEFYCRTSALEMNEALTDEEVDTLENIKSEISKLFK